MSDFYGFLVNDTQIELPAQFSVSFIFSQNEGRMCSTPDSYYTGYGNYSFLKLLNLKKTQWILLVTMLQNTQG